MKYKLINIHSHDKKYVLLPKITNFKPKKYKIEREKELCIIKWKKFTKCLMCKRKSSEDKFEQQRNRNFGTFSELDFFSPCPPLQP